MAIYHVVAISRPDLRESYWTLEREPPFDQGMGCFPRFHLKGDADREATRLAALDGER